MKDNTINMTGNMTRAKFVKDVVAEIKHIKSVATAEEVARLNINWLDANHVHNCIYGQMTGECNSRRAKEMMPKTYDDILKKGPSVNVTNEKTFASQDMRPGTYFTALEKYLHISNEKTHAHIIAFLKDEVKKLAIK